MTMLSFRVDDAEAALARRWADALGIDRSELLRRALHRQLVDLAAQLEPARWEEHRSRLKTGRTGPMRRGEVWFAATPGGDRPVLVLTRDPVANRVGAADVRLIR